MDQLANIVIDRLGGTSAVARICECKPPSVHGWRQTGIPKARLQFLRLAYPEIFRDLPREIAASGHMQPAQVPA